MLPEPVAGALDLNDDGMMMKDAVEECGGYDGIAEDLALFGEAGFGGNDHGAALRASVDKWKKRLAPPG